MSNPANSTIRAPAARCASWSGVFRGIAGPIAERTGIGTRGASVARGMVPSGQAPRAARGGFFMKAGLVGYAQSGKTMLFNALTGLHKGSVPGGRGHVNLGAIKVPDPRVDALSAIFKPRKTTFAEMV